MEGPADEYVEISVSDNGKGISAQNLGKIFDPFYQVCDGQHVASTGTGIGLSLSKGIIELHSGSISVQSSPGKGTTFKVLLPRGKKHLLENEKINDFRDEEDHTHYLLPPDADEIDNETVIEVNHEFHTVLIVEDNYEVRNYIKTHLKDTYNLLEAENGEEGFSKAISEMPDLIISDVMMPGIDGLEMCSRLKNEVNTSHIPIILLTALTTFRQIKEGFEVGADDYIIKPFNSDLLKMKANSLIVNRERLRKAFSKKFPFEQVLSGSSTFDEQFLDKIYTVMDKYLSDSEFDLDAFSGEIGMSRANLYRKIKALTNFAPNELLKNYRLRAAVKLLLENKYSVSEISYMVGFGTPAYFSNCFKKTYQHSPSEYLEMNGFKK
jgi:DNA-binding response OmpR family regulator